MIPINPKQPHRLFEELTSLLCNNQEMLAFPESALLDGVCFWDLENPDCEWMSDAFWELLGLDPKAKQGLASEWRSLANQEDLQSLQSNINKHCLMPSHPIDQVIRLTHKTGKSIWVRFRGVAIRNQSAQPQRLLGSINDITALKEQEVQRSKVEQKQASTFQNQNAVLTELEKIAEIGTWELDLQSGEITWSQQTKQIHDVSDDYKPNLSSSINFYKNGNSRQKITTAIERGIGDGKSWALELELVTAFDRTIWVRSLGMPHFENGECIRLFGVIQDITRQKQEKDELNAAREEAVTNAVRMQLANDSVGMGVWELNVATGTLQWDDAMFSLYGISESQFSGDYSAWENSIYPSDREIFSATLSEAITQKKNFDAQFRIVLPNQKVRHIKANAQMLTDFNDNVTRVIGVNYDVSEKVSTLEVLEQAKLKAEAASQAKSDFLANMSHEIRTPMNAIMGALQLLQHAALDEHLRKVLKNASFSAQSLLTIVNDILDYSKIESGMLQLEEKAFSMREVVESVQYEIQPLANNKDISFEVTVNDDLESDWVGDIVRVKQILLNITSNAVKFTHSGRVRLRIKGSTHQRKKSISIVVSDTGIGMSKEACEHIFDRFTQADTSITRKFGGTGLGMSISLSLVKLMGGTLRIKSKEGRGTTVKIVLPLQCHSESNIKEDIALPVAPDMSDMKILVAEDNMINQVVIEAFLRDTGADITLVENGKQAVEAIEKEQFDLVLMDIQMPEMDGMQAQKKIKTLKSDLPVIALTANIMELEVQTYLNQGFADFIGKPVDVKQLYDFLEKYTSAKH